MNLRLQLLLVSFVLLVLPWSGWRLLVQMEQLLRQGQEQALLASADTLARALERYPAGLPPAAPRLFVQTLTRMPRLDGDFAEWHGVRSEEFRDQQGALRLRLAVARIDENRYLRIEAFDRSPQRGDAHWPGAAQFDHLRLRLGGGAAELDLRLANANDGPLLMTAADGSPATLRLSGHWRQRPDGYAVELLIPSGWPVRQLGVQVVDADAASAVLPRVFGMGDEAEPASWPLWERNDRRAGSLQALVPDGVRLRLVDGDGWIYAESGEIAEAAAADDLPWWKRQLWYALAFSDAPHSEATDAGQRIDADEVWQAISGVPASAWRRDRRSPRLLLSAALPLRVGNEVRGAVLLEREQQTLLLADQALSGLLGGSLLAMLAAVGSLLWFAGRLSRRIRELRDAVDGAFGSDGKVQDFIPDAAGDEIGDLARSFSRMLAEVGASQTYLRGLAGKLSHELNTPLAVVRGALENIDLQALDAASRKCVERAQGGGERLALIVRAMSEASRVEQAIAAADAEEVDLVELLRQCVDSYRVLLAPRKLHLQVPDSPLRLHCAPELLVQALDKLIDNARGFCPEDGWVRIALERGVEGPQIVIANSGPRLPEGGGHRLFESLVSLRPGGRSAGVHLGFGLFIVRLVAELHRGSAEAHDLAAGDGVEFVLKLRGMPRLK